MHQTGEFGYLDGGTFQVLEMPYVGKELSMVVLLPKKADGLADLEKSLTADKLGGLGRKRRTSRSHVTPAEVQGDGRVRPEEGAVDAGHEDGVRRGGRLHPASTAARTSCTSRT